MSSATVTNGKPQRRQLADQLDRLDGIIDALAEGLNQAVADACREGTRLAVRDVLIEIASNPELRAMLAPQAVPVPAPKTPDVPPEPKRPSVWHRIKAKVAAARTATVAAVAKVKKAVAAKYTALTASVAAIGAASGEALPVRRALGVALGVGVLVALACSQAPETVSAAVAGIGATCTTAFAQIGSWLRRAARRVGIVNRVLAAGGLRSSEDVNRGGRPVTVLASGRVLQPVRPSRFAPTLDRIPPAALISSARHPEPELPWSFSLRSRSSRSWRGRRGPFRWRATRPRSPTRPT
jgi:hypothetical protein